MQKTSSILSLLTTLLLGLALSACGSKGPLYQTPDSEPVAAEEVQGEQETTELQSKKID